VAELVMLSVLMLIAALLTALTYGC